MGDISTGLIEFAEHKRLLFERVRHKLGDVNAGVDNNVTPYLPSAVVNLTDEVLSSLYIEAAETLELQVELGGVKITEDRVKMKWMGLYTMALAKEVHARVKFSTDLGNGLNIGNDWVLTEYKNLLSESKEEKYNLIKLINGVDKK